MMAGGKLSNRVGTLNIALRRCYEPRLILTDDQHAVVLQQPKPRAIGAVAEGKVPGVALLGNVLRITRLITSVWEMPSLPREPGKPYRLWLAQVDAGLPHGR
jgi:hypothetical protein